MSDECIASEAAGPRQLFRVERLDELLFDCGGCSVESCIARVRDAVADFCAGAPPTDDQTLTAMRAM